MSSSDEEFRPVAYVAPRQRHVSVPAAPATEASAVVAEPPNTVETDVMDPQPVSNPRDVDDSDAFLDSALDVAAWRLRELLRLRRDSGIDTIDGAEPEDSNHIKDLAPDAQVGQRALAEGIKYHKGAFFQDTDDARTAELMARDYSAPTAREVAEAHSAAVHDNPADPFDAAGGSHRYTS